MWESPLPTWIAPQGSTRATSRSIRVWLAAIPMAHSSCGTQTTSPLALGDGFALALNPGDGARPLTSFCTSTTPAAAPEEVRALRERLLGAGEMLTEDEDSESFVSIKVTDPDGYRVEISWEDLTRDPL